MNFIPLFAGRLESGQDHTEHAIPDFNNIADFELRFVGAASKSLAWWYVLQCCILTPLNLDWGRRILDPQMSVRIYTQRRWNGDDWPVNAVATTSCALERWYVMAYTIARRTNEIGIRVAIGTTSGGVLRMALKETPVNSGFGGKQKRVIL
jgi:hypothetical protein